MLWNKPEIQPEDGLEPVLVLVEEEGGTKYQYVCWPPDGDTGWLMCMPQCEENVDIDLSKLDLEILGWRELSRE